MFGHGPFSSAPFSAIPSAATPNAPYPATYHYEDVTQPYGRLFGRRAAGIAIAIMSAGQTTTPPQPPLGENILADKWFAALSEPVRQKPRVQPANNPAFSAYIGADPFPEPTFTKWYQPLSEPVRLKPRLGTPNQQAFFKPDYRTGTFEPIFVDKWHAPFSEPVRLPRRVQVGAQPHLALTFQFEFTLDKWYRPLNEPVRLPKRLHAALNEAFFTHYKTVVIPPTVNPDSYYPRLEEPVRLKPSLRTAQHQAFHFAPAEPFGESNVISQWFVPLAQPYFGKYRQPWVPEPFWSLPVNETQGDATNVCKSGSFTSASLGGYRVTATIRTSGASISTGGSTIKVSTLTQSGSIKTGGDSNGKC